MKRFRKRIALIGVVASLATASFGSRPANADVEDYLVLAATAAGAFGSTHSANAQSMVAYAAYLTSTPQYLCTIEIQKATGTSGYVSPTGDIVYAQDAAAAVAHCSIGPGGNRVFPFSTKLVITFQNYDANGVWQDIGSATCQLQSVGGESVVPCWNNRSYAPDDPSIGTWHRAKFELQEPVILPPRYEGPWASAYAEAP